ncbi:hypothetical protein CLU79DRAFT_787095 [Phycomyces nitens]|nr:hypothetical protein CLU79DRAFT_787095 [Phycomyces nitens]
MDQQVLTTALPMLILGLGWTGQFLVELLNSLNIKYAATTRDGRGDTIKWTMPSTSYWAANPTGLTNLPSAQTVLITFPVINPSEMTEFMDAYESEHGKPQWIILSSTRPFNGTPSDRHGPMDPSRGTDRSGSEEIVLSRGGTVLHLAGLWGAARQPRNWVSRFPTEDAIRAKLLTRQLHLIHGKDVARAILAVHEQFKNGERWIVTDKGCYDWIRLFLAWGSPEQIAMARSLAKNDDVCRNALGPGTLEEIVARGGVMPRLDSNEFWDTFGISPTEYLTIE